MRPKTFENYLIDRHADQYVGTDDSMPDDYADWESRLDVTDVIEMAEVWGKILVGEKSPDAQPRI